MVLVLLFLEKNFGVFNKDFEEYFNIYFKYFQRLPTKQLLTHFQPEYVMSAILQQNIYKHMM